MHQIYSSFNNFYHSQAPNQLYYNERDLLGQCIRYIHTPTDLQEKYDRYDVITQIMDKMIAECKDDSEKTLDLQNFLKATQNTLLDQENILKAIGPRNEPNKPPVQQDDNLSLSTHASPLEEQAKNPDEISK